MLSEAKGQAADTAPSRTVPFDTVGESAVLAVFPHPDDESFAAGGTLALCNEAGVRTMYLCGTYGDMGRRMGRPAFTNREALRDVRTVELRDACAVLGCELAFMGLRDKCIEFEDPADVAAQVRRVIEEFAPTTVITYYPGHGVHSDHDALGQATVLAVRAMPVAARPRILAVAVGDPAELREQLGEPHVRADIRGVKDRKLDALRAHRSQTETMFAHMDDGAKEDGQTSTFSERLTVREEFYVLDADAPTLVERARG